MRIRRGLYSLAERYRKGRLHLLALASRIYAPSYISLESALSARSWIPEQVMAVTSAVFRRSATFHTPFGRFEFRRTPFRTLVGVERVSLEEPDAYLLASPLRALADLAHDRSRAPMRLIHLVGSMRIPRELIQQVRTKDFDALLADGIRGQARRFLLELRQELNR